MKQRARPGSAAAARRSRLRRSRAPSAIGVVAHGAATSASQGATSASCTCRSAGPATYWHFRHPLDFVGSDGGGGIGAGPGITVGAALALKGTARLPVAHPRRRRLPDGRDGAVDRGALQGPAACSWSCNNRSFFNDEVHQERVAKTRGRPVENKWIGQRIDDPTSISR